MNRLQRDLADCSALVVDANPTSRSILASQLRDFGVGAVAQTSRVADARRALEARRFDIVLCEQYFPGTTNTGQDLLDDLRRAQLLPYATVFVMITGEANYAKVAEAAESALDSYLLKPHTADALGQRLRQARDRKRALAGIFEAIEADQYEVAARLCLKRFQDRSRYWLYAARLGAELLLRLEHHDAARRLYEAVIAAHALPWARLGVARSQAASGASSTALRTLDALITAQPGYADAYDVMGRVQMEQGQLEQALDTFDQACRLTPNSITRLQKQGMLAFMMGDREAAARSLARATLVGSQSKLFDCQSLVLLAFVRFREKDRKALQRCAGALAAATERLGPEARLVRFQAVVGVLVDLMDRKVAAALGGLRDLAGEIGADGFDVEAACNLLTLLAELAAAEIRLDDADGWVDRLALRFTTSRGVSELLARAASPHPPYEQQVRAAHQRITHLAEQALSHALAGDAGAAVHALMAHAEQTCNAKLADTARLTLQRHRERIADADELATRIDAMRLRFAAGANVPALGVPRDRNEGGVALRSGGAAAAAPANLTHPSSSPAD
jgi:CheY-like chemotaxis protein